MDESLRQVAMAIEQATTSEMDGKYLTFWTDNQLFGISIEYVVQIVGLQEITQVPEFPDYAKGIINLRGSIIPVIDARLRLGKQETTYNERTCIIVTHVADRDIGVIVDEVDAVNTIDDACISAPPQVADSSGSYLTGIGKLENRVILLMDICRVLGADVVSM